MMNGAMENFSAGLGDWGVVPLEAAAGTHGAGDDSLWYLIEPCGDPIGFWLGVRDGFLAALTS
ncbi:MAG TPA: hypothetical protein VFQ38_05715 [Longimicrobiales bacterium]|nr:hypothetical protein [Longimicrobiales bacterium]